jgi:signal transduction histidine kinase
MVPGWRGSEELIRRMVDNVVDNAIVHNKPGGWVKVSTASEDLIARLVVESGGAVIDASRVRQLAQPFRRLGAERTGSCGASSASRRSS